MIYGLTVNTRFSAEDVENVMILFFRIASFSPSNVSLKMITSRSFRAMDRYELKRSFIYCDRDISVKRLFSIARITSRERQLTSGLDYLHMLQVSELLKKLRDKGKTVIIVTHDIELIKNACTIVIPFACLKT